ncbi:18289_t:CDS:2, partial [Racocetra persica]
MSNESLSEGELTKIPKREELLKALGINILRGHPNSLASNITIPELENCHKYNEGTASAEVQDIDMSEAVEDEGKETSNLTGAVSKLSVDGGKAIPQSETKFMEPDKVQGLIKELSMPSELIDDNDRENKSKESKPKTLLQLYYNASRAEKQRVKEIKSDNSRFNDQQAKELVYGEIATNLLGFTRESL